MTEPANDSAKPDTTEVPPGAVQVMVERKRGDKITQELDWVAEEVPTAIVFNGISHAVMMMTPADWEDMAVGFAFTEGIIDRSEDVYDIEVVKQPLGVELKVTIPARLEQRLKERRRQLAGRTGCGICGLEELDAVVGTLNRVIPVQPSAQAIEVAMQALPRAQRLKLLTGGVHAAAWSDLSTGRIECIREDIGRHNALDKLIGALLRQRLDIRAGFVVMTSRGSYELVQKASRAGIGALAVVSAASSLAVASTTACGLQLYRSVCGAEHQRYME